MWSSILLFSALAEAGACCVAATSAAPAALGECEHVLVGVGVSSGGVLGRWDDHGAVRGSSMGEVNGAANLTLAARWDRKAQVLVDVPFALTSRTSGDLHEVGGGIGDIGARILWDPLEEKTLPTPVFVGGVKLPTGRDWRASETPLQSDVTGMMGTALSAGLLLDRTLGKFPWSVGATTQIPLGGEAPSLSAVGAVGAYLGHTTVIGRVEHQETFAVPGRGLTAARRTAVGARVVYGKPIAWRVWGDVSADLPIPGIGRNAMQKIQVGGGLAFVR